MYLWLAFFANQHTNSTEKHRLFGIIAPKRMKIEIPCKNEKCLNLGASSDTSVSFSHEDKNFPIFKFGL